MRCVSQMGGPAQLDFAVIQGIDPGDQANVEVTTQPRVGLNLALGKSLNVTDIGGNNTKIDVYLKEDEIKIMYDLYEIPTEIDVNEDGFQFALRPHYFLPPNDSVTVKAAVDIFFDDTYEKTETTEVTFATGELLEEIPKTNVAFSYPMANMQNFYQDEMKGRHGYVQLVAGQPFLLDDDEATYTVEVIAEDGSKTIVPFEYNSWDYRINFTMPPLANETAYELKLMRQVNIPSEVYVQQAGPTETSDSTTVPPTMTGPNPANGSKELFTIPFRTSKYDLFKDKMSDFQTAMAKQNYGNARVLTYKAAIGETFDAMELQGGEGEGALVDLKDYRFATDMVPSDATLREMYMDIPYPGPPADEIKIWRNSREPFETLPIDAVSFINIGSDAGFSHHIFRLVKQDLENLQQHINDLMKELADGADPDDPPVKWTLPHGMRQLLTASAPDQTGRTYVLEWEYRLPGESKTNSHGTITFSE